MAAVFNTLIAHPGWACLGFYLVFIMVLGVLAFATAPQDPNETPYFVPRPLRDMSLSERMQIRQRIAHEQEEPEEVRHG